MRGSKGKSYFQLERERKRKKCQTEFKFLLGLVVCIGFGNTGMWRKKSQTKKIQHKNIENIL